jgi:hypothetical protein
MHSIRQMNHSHINLWFHTNESFHFMEVTCAPFMNHSISDLCFLYVCAAAGMSASIEREEIVAAAVAAAQAAVVTTYAHIFMHTNHLWLSLN